MQQTIHISTPDHNGLYDITNQVAAIVSDSGIQSGMVNVYAQGATAAIMIQENWDDSVQRDVVSMLNKLIPNGVWEHDRQDGNGRQPAEPGRALSGTAAVSQYAKHDQRQAARKRRGDAGPRRRHLQCDQDEGEYHQHESVLAGQRLHGADKAVGQAGMPAPPLRPLEDLHEKRERTDKS